MELRRDQIQHGLFCGIPRGNVQKDCVSMNQDRLKNFCMQALRDEMGDNGFGDRGPLVPMH